MGRAGQTSYGFETKLSFVFMRRAVKQFNELILVRLCDEINDAGFLILIPGWCAIQKRSCG